MFEEFEKPKGVKKSAKSPDESGHLGGEEEGIFHTMPTGLRGDKVVIEKKPQPKAGPPSAKVTKPRKIWKYYLILGIIIVLVLAGLVGGVFFWYKKVLINRQRTESTLLENTGLPLPHERKSKESEKKVLKISVKDEEGKLVGRVEFLLPAGAVNSKLKLKLSGRLPNPDEQFSGEYKIIGPIYEITPGKFELLKPATLELFYIKDLVDKNWEKDLKIVYFKSRQWKELVGRQNVNKNLIITSFKKLPGNMFALAVRREKLMQETNEEEIAPNIPSTLDRDKDGLTDLEEGIYQTDVLNPDTDGDTYPDGLEVVNIYSPLAGPGIRIAVSGLVTIYNSSGYNWSIFYPITWQVNVLPETEGREVIFRSNTGEFVEVAVQENPKRLSSIDWYLTQYPLDSTDLTELKRTKYKLRRTELAGQPAVWSADGLTLYMAQGDKIYVLTYNIGGAAKLNFRSTFAMMLKSFRLAF